MDNIIVRILTRIFDFLLLNIMWLLCSLPVITAGASFTALYSVMLKASANGEGYILKDFLKAFRSNFRQSTVVWLILLAVGAAFGVDIIVVFRMQGGPAQAGGVLLCAAGIVYMVEVLFVFPLIATFENTTGNMIKNAFLIPVSRLPFALPVLLMTGMCIVLTLLNQTTIMAGAVIWSLIGVSVLTYANSFFIRKVFEPYM